MRKLRGNISVYLFLGMYLFILPIFYTKFPAYGENYVFRIIVQLFISSFIVCINFRDLLNGIKLKHILAGILLGILTFLVSTICINGLVDLFGPPMPNMLLNVKSISPTISFVSGVILGPICEELVYRKHLYRKIELYISNPVLSALIVSFVFAISHCATILYSGQFQYIHQMLFYIPMALIFQFGYNKSNDIRVPMLSHILYNALVLL